jgi:anti-sigma B factor antagonist
MESEPVELTVGIAGDVGLVEVIGEVDANTAPELRDTATTLLKDGLRSVVIACERLTFMDSAGLTALIELHALAAERGATFAVRNPTELVSRLLRITGLDAEICIEETEPGG